MSVFKKKAIASSILCAIASVGFVASAWAAEEQAIDSGDALESFHLAEVVVNGQRYIAGEYMRATNNIGILGEQDAMNSPISVNTISEKAVEDFMSSTEGLSKILSLVPSVQKTSDNATDTVNIRGFSDDGRAFMVNGIPGMQAMTRQSTNYIDSVDVVEGPSTGITGSSFNAKGGGTININSKKAYDEPNSNVGLKFHSRGAHEEYVDIGRRFGENNRYGIRINASNTNGERAVEGWDLEQRNIYVNLDQKSDNSKTNFMVGYTYTDSQGRPYGFSIKDNYIGSALPSAPDGKINFNPKWRRDKNTNFVMTLNHEQKINDHLSAFINAGHFKQDWYYYTGFSKTLLNENGDFTATSDNFSLIEKRDYAQIGLRGDFMTGDLKHNYSLGVDRMWHYYGGARDFAEVVDGWKGNLHGVNPGNWEAPGFSQSAAYYGTRARISGWSVMDSITTSNEKLNVLVGINGKSIKNDRYNADDAHVGKNVHSNDVSPVYGINYTFNPTLAVYANHSEDIVEGSYISGSKYANRGESLDPYRVKQNEIGVKFKTGDFFHKVSYFDIKKGNSVEKYVVGVDKPYLVIEGEQRHKGIEYMATGSIADKWNLIGGFMYLDASQETGTNADGTPKASNGKRPNGVPEWTANLGVEYKADESFSGLLRTNYVGSSYVLNERYSVPSYFTLDLGLKYKTELNGTPVTLNAMCYNITDKNYWMPSGNTLHIGAPRTFMLSAEFEL